MRGFILIAIVVAAYTASAVPLDQNEPDFIYQRFIKFPDEDGVMHEVDLEEEPDISFLNRIARNGENNTYLLFTRRNPTSGQPLELYNPNTIWNSNFKPNVTTVFVVHGWRGSHTSRINPTIRDALLGKYDVNVIVVDWNHVSKYNYVSAAMGVPAVGRALGEFIFFLSSASRAPLDTMHLVGFSLGAHVVGNAGRYTGSKVARITGLDPAGPLWTNRSPRLRSTDAIYVEAIHTDGGYTIGGLGIGKAIAQVDFFPNGGISQPGCILNPCNHSRAWELYAATVSYNHLVGRRCSNTVQIAMNWCRGTELHMGNNELKKSGSGMYRLSTARNYPY